MNSKNNPTILITGSNGQLGMEFRELAEKSFDYSFVLTSKDELDITDESSLREIFQKYQPDYFINCAAYTAVDRAEEEENAAYLINAKAVGLIAAQCKKHVCRFLHISTDYVFDGKATTPYSPDSEVSPETVYGASKAEGEKLAFQQNKDSIIIRTSWVYSTYGKNFVKTMMRLMSEKAEISVVNDQTGSPTYARDLAVAIMELISISGKKNLWQPGIYHFSNSGQTTWYEFAVTIGELIGTSCIINPINTAQYPTAAKRPRYSVLETKKIQDVYEVQVRSWEDALRDCISKIIQLDN